MNDDDLARYSSRFARNLDGRWATMGLSGADPGYAVWVFRGSAGHREAKGSLETFRITWIEPMSVEIEWSNGDTDAFGYEFTVATDTTRQVCLCSRGRAIFAFESVPLVRLDAF